MEKVAQVHGGKEQGLFELQKHAQRLDYSIPEFFVLEETQNEDELIKIATQFNECDVIVRSNSVMENNEFGFDGIYTSILIKNWDLNMLKQACKEVSDSLFSPDAVAYRKKIGITNDSMRIIIQKFIGQKEIALEEELHYFVIETSINAQRDISIVVDGKHDFINQEESYKQMVLSRKGELLTSTDTLYFMGQRTVLGKLGNIAIELQNIFGPVSLEGAYIENMKSRDAKVFLFQRRFLAKDLYQAASETVPSKYTDKDILFRSNSYRGAGKIERLPIVVMPTIDNVRAWEDELRNRISQLKSDVILFVWSMRLGVLSSRILNDYTVLSGVKAIISSEKIDFSSHAFKVASLARIPFVSVENFPRVETLDIGSLFFTENQAVFCIDEKREVFKFDRIQRSRAKSLVAIAKEKRLLVEFSEEKQKFGFQLDLRRLSFNDLEISFHRLLEDVSNEIWLLGNDDVGTIGFKCENAKGHIVRFSGWANYLDKEGHINLDNFREHFENNQVEWSLIQKIAMQLGVG